jgi:UTP--hexose-1-phosphate uridylyltransferase
LESGKGKRKQSEAVECAIEMEEVLLRFVAYGAVSGLIREEDYVYIYNSLAGLLQYEPKEYREEAVQEKIKEIMDIGVESGEVLEKLLSEILDFALLKGIIEDNSNITRDLFDTRVMGILTDRPSSVQNRFCSLYRHSPKEATDFFYKFSQDSDYIRRYRIKKDIRYTVESPYGELDISINLSKPEKDPKKIALLGKTVSHSYPSCMLCKESVGYFGRLDFPARENHRVIPLTLADEPFYFQYSPYVYYPEHCIVFHKEHRPMKIDETVFRKLCSFLTQFPHYFIGSNADLPIVGGSILSHEHFQGGRYIFPMEKAGEREAFSLQRFPGIHFSIVNWPMSVIRLRGKDAEDCSSAASFILSRFRAYNDKALGILSHTGETLHNTITPIARMRDGLYELDLVLRNNRTTEEHPLGLFHPHEEWHNIKKENIGLIEVMGLAVLPSRLEGELSALGDAIVKKEDISKHPVLMKHFAFSEGIKRKYSSITKENIHKILQKEVGRVFLEVLRDAGIFKDTEEGREGFRRFVQSLEREA